MDSVYPRRCPVCDGVLAWGKETMACPDCMERLSFVTPPVCARCGKQLLVASQVLCSGCTEHPRSFERGICLLNYEEHAQESMIRFKYGRRSEYAAFYGRLMAERLGDEIRAMSPQCIVPVPIHPERFMERGYNQALLLAQELGRRMDIPVEREMLVRVKKTIVQKELGAQERLDNLSDAFGVLYDAENGEAYEPEYKRLIPYDRVLLVDDIYTTGATIEACTRTLMAAGVKKVYFAAVCTGSER